MPEHLQGVLHTAVAVVEGGREGHGRSVATVWRLDASGSRITSRVGIGLTAHGGFGPTVALDLYAPHLTAEQAADAMPAHTSATRTPTPPAEISTSSSPLTGCCCPPGRSWRVALSALAVPREAL
jgi:hypothetical protein